MEEEVEKDAVIDWDDPYSSVDAKVMSRMSLFIDEECVEQLEPALWSKPGSGLKLEILPCNDDDRICHRCKDWDYFLMYCCVFIELKLKLPFTSFECGVLTQMRCAPSQLHPNSWAFVRAFEVLMEFLEVNPSLEVFFALFQAKGVKKGKLINLNSILGRQLFSAYRSSFKEFKEMFIKVRNCVEDFPFYLDENLIEKFPLYWNPKPRQILGMAKMCKENEYLVEYLVNISYSNRLLSVAELMKWEKNESYVRDQRAPKVNTAGLRSFLKQKNIKKEVVVSMGEAGIAETKQSSRISMKKRKVEVVGKKGKVVDLTSSEVEKSGVTSFFAENQKKLHGFSNEQEHCSLWSAQYPFVSLADDVAQTSCDVELVNDVGDVTLYQYLQVVAARLLCIGCTREIKHIKDDLEKGKNARILQESTEKAKQLDDALVKLSLTEKENEKIKGDFNSLGDGLKKRELKITELENRVIDLVGLRKEADAWASL
ncbi:hypothetical protein PIB30_086396 [Stylosanthes scabra]|uniref:Transposase (putative) gypsy type domain-containing protein n=1 Tax=Stylosanthes scabra TaxID=79078 RepID=A0ABU6ZRW5_9FABA|nr:hypothetical protein [Stylosanthes scabra]